MAALILGLIHLSDLLQPLWEFLWRIVLGLISLGTIVIGAKAVVEGEVTGGPEEEEHYSGISAGFIGVILILSGIFLLLLAAGVITP